MHLSLDFRGMIDASPNPYLVLDRDLHIAFANRAYLQSVKRDLTDLVGRWAWEAFPTDPETEAQAIASFERVKATKQPDTMALLRFDVPRPEAEGGGMERRWWSITHAPVLDGADEVALIVQHPIDVTNLERLREAVTTSGDAEVIDLLPAHTGIFTRAQSVSEANLALKAEGDRLRELFAQAPSFIAVLRGPEHVFEQANAAYLRLIGHRDVVGQPVAEALPEVAGQGFVDLLDRVYRTAEPFVGRAVPISLQAAPGAAAEERVLDFLYQPMTGPDGRVSGIFVEGTDVTDRVRADAALRESEARYRQIVEGADDFAIVTLDEHGIITGWNSGAERVVGWPREEAIGQPGAMFFTPEDREAGIPDHEMKVAASDERAVDERWHLHRDGTRFWGSGLMMRLEGEGGGYLKMFRDRTAEHEAEAALRELNATLEARVAERTAEREQLARIVDATGTLIQALDASYRWIALNRATSDVLARLYGRAPALGKSLLDYLGDRPEHLAEARAPWDRALGGEPFSVVGEFGDPGLQRRSYELTFDVLRDAEGRVTGAYMVGTDITDRLRDQARLREAETQLRQSQKMEAMGSLTGGVAHDFNNLLTPIIGSLDRLITRGVGSERERRLMAGALESAERAKTLVQRLLAFARRQPLQPVAVDVGALVEGMAGLIGSTLGPTIEVRVDLAPDLPPAKADPNQLEMALLNLAVNARDAMPAGGTLTISASRGSASGRDRSGLKRGHYVRLAVADTGIGMDAATRERAVEPFFSTKGIGKGTGLGLSMADGLAAQLGGGLTIVSQPGQGTTVELWLPISAEPVGAVDGASAVSPRIETRGRALLVDDEDLVRMSTADMLADLGFDVVEAGSAEDALRLLHEGVEADLLVTDHLMPGMSGAELARTARRLRSGLPVLIVSGYAEVEGLAPDLPRLAKPFRVAELAERVAALMPGTAPVG